MIVPQPPVVYNHPQLPMSRRNLEWQTVADLLLGVDGIPLCKPRTSTALLAFQTVELYFVLPVSCSEGMDEDSLALSCALAYAGSPTHP